MGTLRHIQTRIVAINLDRRFNAGINRCRRARRVATIEANAKSGVAMRRELSVGPSLIHTGLQPGEIQLAYYLTVSTVSLLERRHGKPLKRFLLFEYRVTGLKPGVNEIYKTERADHFEP